ncbi:hypothetical protein ACHQM5_023383 [Ranunculus cassubicifolius]
MMKSIAIPCSSPVLPYSTRNSPSKICCSLRSHVYIPKLEPFSGRSKIDRGVKGPSFIEKSESELLDYCSVLEGDESFSCWTAYFELKQLEREMPKDDVEKLIHQTGGVKSLIDCVHGVSEVHKRRNAKVEEALKPVEAEKKMEKSLGPIPDGLPKSKEEIEEEEKARMPDSAFTRLLRTKGRSPAWFSQAPDHETD